MALEVTGKAEFQTSLLVDQQLLSIEARIQPHWPVEHDRLATLAGRFFRPIITLEQGQLVIRGMLFVPTPEMLAAEKHFAAHVNLQAMDEQTESSSHSEQISADSQQNLAVGAEAADGTASGAPVSTGALASAAIPDPADDGPEVGIIRREQEIAAADPQVVGTHDGTDVAVDWERVKQLEAEIAADQALIVKLSPKEKLAS
jgi:hypothetical protein